MDWSERAADLRSRSDAVRFDLKGDVGVEGVTVVGVVGKLPDASSSFSALGRTSAYLGGERGWSDSLRENLWDCLFSLLAFDLTREAGVGGPTDSGDSISSSISSEGIESVDCDRYDDSAATVLVLAILHESPSRSLSFSSSPLSGGLCRILHDFGLDVDSAKRKSSRQRLSFLMFLPDRLRRIVNPRGFWTEATARSAAIDGGRAFGS